MKMVDFHLISDLMTDSSDSKRETENFDFLGRQNYFIEKNYVTLLPLLISICVQK